MAVSPPDELGTSGRKLWSATLEQFELSAHETGLLHQLCRCADVLDQLQAVIDHAGVMDDTSPQGARVNPAVVELRQMSTTYARLAAALQLPAGLEDDLAHQRRGPRGAYKPRAV